MNLGLLAAVGVGVAAAGWILAPLLRGAQSVPVRSGEAVDAADEARDLQAQREMLMASLRDLEDDHATGKIDERDYAELKERLTTQAAVVLKRLDEARATAEREAERPTLRSVGGAAESERRG
jgi:hypothetical protein